MPVSPDSSDPSPPPPPGTIDVPVHADSPTSFAAMSTPSAAAPSETAAPPPDGLRPRAPRLRGPRRQLVLIAGIGGAVLISALSISLLFAKWAKAPANDTTIVAWGESGWEGAKVTVTGPDLPGGSLSDVFTDTLLIRFHVPQGQYRIKVVKDGKTLAERDGRLYHKENELALWWPFRRHPPATGQAKP